jgi:uncharacterized lipoprotein YmbA
MTRILFSGPGALALLLLCMPLAAGCSLSKPYPDKTLHAIEVGQPPAATGSPSLAAVRIDRVRVAEPFNDTTFVYKIGDSKYTMDYYNGFIAEPGRLLTGELSEWLANSKVFSSVLTGDSAADSQLLLQTNVMELYGDFSSDQPKAVIAARFFLLDVGAGHSRVIFDKSYQESEPITGKDSDALIKGWQAATRRIFTSLVADLRSSPVAASTSAAP